MIGSLAHHECAALKISGAANEPGDIPGNLRRKARQAINTWRVEPPDTPEEIPVERNVPNDAFLGEEVSPGRHAQLATAALKLAKVILRNQFAYRKPEIVPYPRAPRTRLRHQGGQQTGIQRVTPALSELHRQVW